MTCKNCGKAVIHNFCSACGQKSNVDKITFSTLSNELSETIFQVNRGFFFTVKELFVRPGDTIRDYLDGKRKRHYKPIPYLLLMSALYFLITQWMGEQTFVNDIIGGFFEGVTVGEGEHEKLITNPDLIEEVPAEINWLADNYTYLILFLLPLFSLCSFLCFKKYKTNYLEHVVLNSYITGQQAILYSFHALLGSFIDHQVFEASIVFLGILYCFWVYIQFFKAENNIWIVVRSIFTYVLYLLSGTIVFFMVLAVLNLVQ